MQPHSFELEEDTSGFKGYVRGGIVAQFKRPKQLAFQPLQQAIQSPGEFLFSDFSKIERPGLLHVAFQALDAFQVSSCSLACRTAKHAVHDRACNAADRNTSCCINYQS